MAFNSNFKDIAMSRVAVQQTGAAAKAPTTVSTTGIKQDIIEPGNIDILNRPLFKMPNGAIATVNSASFEQDGQHILVPTVLDDKTMVSPQGAWQHYQKTGQHLGKFKTLNSANIYAQRLHEQQDAYYNNR